MSEHAVSPCNIHRAGGFSPGGNNVFVVSPERHFYEVGVFLLPSAYSLLPPLPPRSLARIQFATTLPRRKRFIKISFLAALNTMERAREGGKEKERVGRGGKGEKEKERERRRNYQADRAIMTAQRARVIALFVPSRLFSPLPSPVLFIKNYQSWLLNRLTCSALP